ncbi:unnamed protein product [Amoebophrya sp. A120]|nr:unnamed protein product [Amoebophrya sp. A120]|eukprot:GSA120T00023367001.1
MVFMILQVKADLENLDKLVFPPDHFWTMDIKNSQAEEYRERITVNKDDKVEIPNTKNATANFLVKWEDAKQHSSISIAEPSRTGPLKGKKLDGEYTNSGQWQDIVAFECRGAEPCKYYPTRGYVVVNAKGNYIPDVDLEDPEGWCGYDEQQQDSIGVYNFEARFVHVKK